jgi:hypothetical protein
VLTKELLQGSYVPVAFEREHIRALSQLTLTSHRLAEPAAHVRQLASAQRNDLISLAESHHVVIRALKALQPAIAGDPELKDWTDTCLSREDARINLALGQLDRVVQELENAGCRTVVMKSLDHWPDIGNDLDLYTLGRDQTIRDVFVGKFHAHVEPRSWGDRLANKWNFVIPGLREVVEVHARRLGQTGEHTAMAYRFISRRMTRIIHGYEFPIPAPEERIIVATLQRMYRHFYFRVCDIVNSAGLVEDGAIDFAELKRAADLGGIWPGVATYLQIVSDYVRNYRGVGLDLPKPLVCAAQFGGERVFVRNRFIRVPLMPEGAGLYTRQFKTTAMRGDVPAVFRLSLLPPLAATAAVAYRITGSDKGIW